MLLAIAFRTFLLRDVAMAIRIDAALGSGFGHAAAGGSSDACCAAALGNPTLDGSRSDTYPYLKIEEDEVGIGHEATVSKIGDEQLFYLMSRGLSQSAASAMVVAGFVEPIVKELPLEYAIEMNRLIQIQMEGSVG